MNDFKGSVAEQNVTISTDIVRTAIVGGNFYQSMLYVYNDWEDFGADTPVYPVVTRQTYKDVINSYAYLNASNKKRVLNNLNSLYYYNADVKVYIIPSSLISAYKLYGYFVYFDVPYLTALSEQEKDYGWRTEDGIIFTDGRNQFDKSFMSYIFDVPFDISKVSGVDTASSLATITAMKTVTNNLGTFFARPAIPRTGTTTVEAFNDAQGNPIGYSPALYQLGYMLSFSNESGVPVGNTADMKALDFQTVLPTDGDDSDPIEGCSATFSQLFEDNYINYFKPVGDGTSNLTNFGGWTAKKSAIVADWIVAYENFINRAACAKIITSGKALKNVRTYNALLDVVRANIFAMTQTGRLENFKMTAPAFSNLPITNGHTISIPNAWEATYVDNVRNVKISGTLTVAN